MILSPLAFMLVSALAWLGIAAIAWRGRGRFYAVFVAVMLGLHVVASSALYPAVGARYASWQPVFLYLQLAVFVHFTTLVWARLRPVWWRALVSVPASFFWGGTFVAWPWAVASAIGFEPAWLGLPYAIALAGVAEGLVTRERVVDITLDGTVAPGSEPRRWSRTEGMPRLAFGPFVPLDAEAPEPHAAETNVTDARSLRVVQITDPHLGPWMSERRLRRICAWAVARDPDLVLLTGDFTTMESNADPDALSRALEPLRQLPGRVFACRGNHDLEAPETVHQALAETGVRLLIDEAARVETAAGPVQILGLDFRWRGRKQHVPAVCARYPREPGVLRLVLLHDPGAFRRLPRGEADLVLSGHTHGGQIGLVSLGLPWTLLRALARKVPDHGLWARGPDRLYVHRGTGHYGFPLRLGVPAERSVLHIHWPQSSDRSPAPRVSP